jgi:hypothetical protein
MVFDTFWAGSDGCSAGFKTFNKSLAVKSIGWRQQAGIAGAFESARGVSLFDFVLEFCNTAFRLSHFLTFRPSLSTAHYLLSLSSIRYLGLASSSSSLRGIAFSGQVRSHRWRWWGLITVSSGNPAPLSDRQRVKVVTFDATDNRVAHDRSACHGHAACTVVVLTLNTNQCEPVFTLSVRVQVIGAKLLVPEVTATRDATQNGMCMYRTPGRRKNGSNAYRYHTQTSIHHPNRPSSLSLPPSCHPSHPN